MKISKTFSVLALALGTICISATVATAENPVPGTYYGLFSESDGIKFHSAGFIKIVVKSLGSYSGFLQFDGDRTAFAGRTGTNAITKSRTNNIGKEQVTISFTADPASSEQIIGTVTSSTWVSEILARKEFRVPFSVTTDFVNRFTAVLPGSVDAAAAPAGDTFLSITNTAAGFFKAIGISGDKQTLGMAVGIPTNGVVPLYVSLYRSRTTYSNDYTHVSGALKTEFLGALMGWVTNSNSDVAPAGSLTWIKTAFGPSNVCAALTTNYYPAGFTNESSLLSSVYVAPDIHTWVLNIAGGSTILQDGNLSGALPNTFTITNVTSAKAVFDAPNSIMQTLNVTRSIGRISGTFIDPDTSLKKSFYGIVLQDQKVGRGFFLGTDQSGSIRLSE